MYGEPGAEYQDDQQMGAEGEDGMGGGAMGGGGGMPPDMGGDMMGGPEGELDDLGAPGAEGEGDIMGAEGEMPMGDEGGSADASQPMESLNKKKPLLTESKKPIDKFFLDRFSKRNETLFERVEILDKNLLINEEFNTLIKSLDEIKN